LSAVELAFLAGQAGGDLNLGDKTVLAKLGESARLWPRRTLDGFRPSAHVRPRRVPIERISPLSNASLSEASLVPQIEQRINSEMQGIDNQ
jgi:hypothetical protein